MFGCPYLKDNPPNSCPRGTQLHKSHHDNSVDLHERITNFIHWYDLKVSFLYLINSTKSAYFGPNRLFRNGLIYIRDST